MKISFKYIAAGALALLSASCSKFLEEHSQNASYIESPADLEELLYGEALSATNRIGSYLHLPADEMKELFVNTGAYSSSTNYLMMTAAGMFRWLDNPFANYTGATLSNTISDDWDTLYKTVSAANSLILNAGYFDQSDPQVAYVKGSAHFLRAWNYFMLVNLYGEPYRKSDPDGGLGVPYKDTPEIEGTKFARNTAGFVYGHIVDDLKEAARLLEQAGDYADSKYKVSAQAAWAMLSRVYLYMERYDEAIAAAAKVTAPLFDLAGSYSPGQGEIFLTVTNPEIIFAQGANGLLDLMPGTYGRGTPQNADGSWPAVVSCSSYGVSDELAALFDDNDIRWSAFFTLSYVVNEPMARKNRIVPTLPGVYESDPITGGELPHNAYYPQFGECQLLRAAEVALNKAEAQACGGYVGDAVATMTDFVKKRYLAPPAVPADGDALIEFIRLERRKELCFEGHRWFDLRRYAVNEAHAQTTSIVHPYHEGLNSTVFKLTGEHTLEAYSATTKGSWILPVPPATIEFCWPNITNLDRTAGVTDGNE